MSFVKAMLVVLSVSALPPHLLNESIGGKNLNSKPQDPEVVLRHIFNSNAFHGMVREAVNFAQDPLLNRDSLLKNMNFGQRVQMGLGELFSSEAALREWRASLKQKQASPRMVSSELELPIWRSLGAKPKSSEEVLRALKVCEDFKNVVRQAASDAQPLPSRTAGPSYAASVRMRIGNALTSVKRVPQTAVINDNQATAKSYWIRGNSFSKEKKYERAIAEYSAGIEKYPKSSRLYAARARAYFAVGDTTRAVADYSSAIHIKPELAFLLARAEVWHARGRNDLAIKDAYEARSSGSQPVWGFLSQLDALVLYGGWEEYKQRLADEIESYKDTEFYPALSALLALVSNEKLHEARSRLLEAKKWPFYETFRHLLIGEIDLALGNSEDALQRFSEVIEKSPRSTKGYYRRAHANWRLGNFSEVKTDLEKCSIVSSGLNDEKSEAEIRLAWLLATCPEEEIRDTLTALEVASKLVKKEPNPQVEALMALAAAFGNREDYLQARKILGRTVVLGPDAKLREILVSMDKSFAEGEPYLVAEPLPRRLFVPR